MPPADPRSLPKFETLYDEAACGLLLTDRNGTIRRTNLTFCHWLGRENDELVDRIRFQNLLNIGGRIFHQTHWAPLLQMQGSVAEVKLDLLHRDGHTIPMIMNAISREHAGEIFHELAVFVAEDRNKYERELLLARKQAEYALARQIETQRARELADARLRLAMEAAQLYVWEIDPVSRERYYEPAVAALLGLPPGHPIDSTRYLAALPASDRERESLAFARVLSHSNEEYRCTYPVNGADGIERTVVGTARSIADEKGVVTRIVGVLQDVTEISQQRVLAEQRALFAEQMVGIVSHDLRNPLSAIVLSVGLLDASDGDSQQKRWAGHIRQGARRMQRMISDLLDFTMARIGSGLQIHAEPIELHTLAADTVAELATLFPGRVIQHASEGAGPCFADADRLIQLLGNLISNAVAYGASDTPVTVTSRIEPGQFHLRVHNSGIAISPSLSSSLFQPMIRGTNTPSAVRSVGLGLYIVREIARAHGGDVEVFSSNEDGTTFAATIPN